MSFWKVILPLAVMVIGGEFAVSKMMQKPEPSVELPPAPLAEQVAKELPAAPEPSMESGGSSKLFDCNTLKLPKSFSWTPTPRIPAKNETATQEGCSPVIGPKLPKSGIFTVNLGETAAFPTICPACE